MFTQTDSENGGKHAFFDLTLSKAAQRYRMTSAAILDLCDRGKVGYLAIGGWVVCVTSADLDAVQAAGDG